MTDQGTRVDILSLEDFNATLTTRLSEAEALLTKLNSDLRGQSPELGTFIDGTQTAAHYSDLYIQYVQRIGRLKSAIVAAQTATGDIIKNYTTTEALNHASATDIVRKLDGVSSALNDGSITGV
jgi:ABC-type transporter Mla subunit MlaD